MQSTQIHSTLNPYSMDSTQCSLAARPPTFRPLPPTRTGLWSLSDASGTLAHAGCSSKTRVESITTQEANASVAPGFRSKSQIHSGSSFHRTAVAKKEFSLISSCAGGPVSDEERAEIDLTEQRGPAQEVSPKPQPSQLNFVVPAPRL